MACAGLACAFQRVPAGYLPNQRSGDGIKFQRARAVCARGQASFLREMLTGQLPPQADQNARRLAVTSYRVRGSSWF
jgi:hypothetical protein